MVEENIFQDVERNLAKGLKIFDSDDFEGYTSPSSKGGERRVIVTKLAETGDSVVVKLHRRRKLKQQVITQYPGLFRENRRYKNNDDVDWGKTLESTDFKQKHNALVIQSVNEVRKLTSISPMVPVPLGVYKSRNGLLGEVYRAYDGPMAVNHSNPDKAKPLTDEQFQYYQEQLVLLSMAGVNTASEELMENNVIVMGDGREDLMFSELPV